MVYLYLSIEFLKIFFIYSVFNVKLVKIVYVSILVWVYLNWMIK